MNVFVAMSGGVDSSVVAFLLKQQGLDVAGFTCDLDGAYEKPIQQAKNICKKLNIQHYVIDLHKEFKNMIVDNFNQQVMRNITPLPCAWCNKIVKFGLLLEFCRKNNAKMATGHYAKIIAKVGHNYEIHRAKDKIKDQTHFLNQINKSALKDILFPLGDFYKSDVFRIAQQNQLFNIEEYKESQDVCFFDGKSYEEYIKNICIVETKGEIRHIATQNVLGFHNGLLKYTIGQRKGFGVSWKEPLYVVEKDFAKNILYVGEEETLYSKSLIVKNVNLLVDLSDNFACEVCLRDKTPCIDANICMQSSDVAKVELARPARAITNGQFCVFYKDDLLLGGGEIANDK